MGKRYVEVSSKALFETIEAVGAKIQRAGGACVRTTHGREVVYELYHHKGSDAMMRVYTSVAEGASSARACDKDAVRLVLGAYPNGDPFKPLGKSRKILRTAPQGLSHAEREKAFLDRLVENIREVYPKLLEAPRCPKCGSLMSLRKTKKGDRYFWGCLGYPACKGTRNDG